MNISAFLGYLNKTRGYSLDADYYGYIETWRQWWKGSVPGIHTRSAEYAAGKRTRKIASLRMPKRICEDWANLLLNDRTTFQIGDEKTAAFLLGKDEQQVGGLLRQLQFWTNANKLVEQAYWSGTGAFVLSVKGIKGVDGQLQAQPDARIELDYDPAPCILPLKMEHGVVKEAAFVSECLYEGKPAVYLQTHAGDEKRRTIRNEWFSVTDSASGVPDFAKLPAPDPTLETITVENSPPWFALFSPAAVKNIDGGTGLGMSVFAEALDEAQGLDLAFDNYREDLRLGHKKIFYSTDICRKVVDKDGVERPIPPDDDVVSQFVTLPGKEGSLDQPNEYHEYNPDLRVDANHKAVQDMLDLFSFKCGLGFHRYKFELGNVTTASEYNGSRQDLVQSANKNQTPIEAALIGIMKAILWAAKNLLNADVDPETAISVDWDDSYISDAETRMAQMRDDALSGLLPRYKYLAARYGVSEEEAHKLADEARTENQQPELSFGGA